MTFSAYSDYRHNDEFIKELEPKNIAFVHEEIKEMERLKAQL